MSYRDLRNLTEMMRALNFPKHLSLESFRQPNFPLVAEMLRWLVLRYDPNAAIMDSVQKEADRILFMKSVVQFLAVKAHLKLNIKRLYQADRHAVKELIKVASLLYDAINVSKQSALTDSTDDYGFADVSKKSEFANKQTEIRKIRELSSLITEKGAVLYDLLEKEIELKRLRQEAINKPPDIDGIGRDIQKGIKAIDDEINKTLRQLENVATDEANLETKTANRREELERLQKRLKSLNSVRPAFMDEYEIEEKKLEKLYEEYIMKFRNLTYLETQLEECHQASQKDLDAFDHRVESAKKQSVFASNEIGENGEDDDGGDNQLNDSANSDDDDTGFQKRVDRPGGASGVKRPLKPQGALGGDGSSGNMYGSGDEDDDEDDSDEDDDSDDDEMDESGDGVLGGRGGRGRVDDDDDDDQFSERPDARGGNRDSGGDRGRSAGRKGADRENSGNPDDDDDDDNF